MYSISQLNDRINLAFLQENFEGEPKELYNPISYTLKLGGKRIRPLLTLLACDLFKGDIEKAINPAMGIEMFHNFTLIHDDIMDNAPIRRGQETVFKKWNVNTAILSGDTLYSIAYKYVSKVDNHIINKVLDIFNKTAIEVCEGQQWDLNFETNQNVSAEKYLEMIRLKTAVLVGACLKIGAVLSDTTEENIANMYNFGENIGMAFQLQDDYLDTFGNEALFGKKIGNDILTNKKTYLYLKAFEMAANTEYHKKLLFFFDPANKISDNEKIQNVKEIFSKLDVDKFTNTIIKVYYDKAMGYLNKLDVEPDRKVKIIEYSNILLKREN